MRTRAIVASCAALSVGSVSDRACASSPSDPGHLFVAARLGTRSFYFDASTPAALTGTTFELDVGARVARHVHVYAFGEVGLYDERSDRISPGPNATSAAFGAGEQLDVNPDGAWDFLVDLSLGYRVLRLPFDTGVDRAPFGVDRYRGWEPLRLRVGPSFLVEHKARIDLLVGAAVGRFGGGGHVETCAVVAACRDSFVVDEDSQSATYFALDLSVGLATWL